MQRDGGEDRDWLEQGHIRLSEDHQDRCGEQRGAVAADLGRSAHYQLPRGPVPAHISYGASGGPGFAHHRRGDRAGHEHRNANWAAARGRWDVASGLKVARRWPS